MYKRQKLSIGSGDGIEHKDIFGDHVVIGRGIKSADRPSPQSSDLITRKRHIAESHHAIPVVAGCVPYRLHSYATAAERGEYVFDDYGSSATHRNQFSNRERIQHRWAVGPICKGWILKRVRIGLRCEVAVAVRKSAGISARRPVSGIAGHVVDIDGCLRTGVEALLWLRDADVIDDAIIVRVRRLDLNVIPVLTSDVHPCLRAFGGAEREHRETVAASRQVDKMCIRDKTLSMQTSCARCWA